MFDATDCDDSDPAINPDATEVCDTVDNDCDGDVDDNDSSLVGAQTWYLDHDGDTFGDSTYPMQSCNQPSGYVADSTDCNDLSAVAFPGGAEICDGLDNDCDGSADDADSNTDPITMDTFYEDFDTDGYGSNTITVLSCNAPAGYVSDSGDCDDANIAINPSVDEQCDSVDNDCDGQVDEPSAIDASVWYLDHDGDTFGDVGFQTVSCAAPTGYVSDDTDCNDLDAMVNSLATEICDGVDNDCDGDIDDADANVDLNTGTMWYADVDQDGYGDASRQQSRVHYRLDTARMIWIAMMVTSTSILVPQKCAMGLTPTAVVLQTTTQHCMDWITSAPRCLVMKSTLKIPRIKMVCTGLTQMAMVQLAAYCNMSLAGGGWTLVGKFTNQDARNWGKTSRQLGWVQ